MKAILKSITVVLILNLTACQKEEFFVSDTDAKVSEETKSNLKFDTKTKKTKTLIAKDWSKVTNLIGRSSHTSEVFDDKMWIIAGGSGNALSEVDVWFSENGTNWKVANGKPPFPNRRGHESVVFRDKLWVTGGLYSGPFNVNNDVWWSSDGKEWKQVQETNFPPVTEHTLTVFKGALWLIGGYLRDPKTDFAKISPEIWRSYDGVKWSRVIKQAPFQGRARHATVVHEGKLWLIGGRYGEGPPNHAIDNEVWFSHDGKKWILASSDPGFPNINDHALVSDGDTMWLSGGRYGTENEIWYSSNGIDWSKANTTKKFQGRSHHTSVMFDGKLWIINGYASHPAPNKYLSDIWSFEEQVTEPIDDVTLAIE